MRTPTQQSSRRDGSVLAQLVGRVRRVTLAACALWVAGALAMLAVLGPPAGVFAWLGVAALLAGPLGLVWAGALAARSLGHLVTETDALRAEVDALHRAATAAGRAQAGAAAPAQAHRSPQVPVEMPLPAPLPAGGPSTQEADPPRATATFRSSRTGHSGTRDSVGTPAAIAAGAALADARPGDARLGDARPDDPADGPGQLSLALGGLPSVPARPLPAPVLIRALNFPETDSDAEGFAALRTALTDPPTARLIRAAQDVLTLLAGDGIYMDELPADRARSDIWRRLAQGERGASVAALGGVHDRMALARVAGRMRGDPVFRDAAHHFLRQFDRSFARFESEADDTEIAAFAETRTTRAFMLLARVAGLFD